MDWKQYLEIKNLIEKEKENNMDKVFGVVVLVLFWLAIALLVIPYLFMLIWNWCMPELFGMPILNFWQAMALLVLSSMLFRNTSTSSSSK